MADTGKELHERKVTPPGTIIIKEGERGDCAYLIQSGKVKVFTGAFGKRVDLGVLEAGQIFGEMALLFDEPRTATVEAVDKCTLIPITREMLRQKMDKSDPTIRALLPMLMKRLVQTNHVILQKHSGPDGLLETASTIYQNIYVTLPAVQRKSFENSVGPKLQEFLEAVKQFRDRYMSYRD